MGRVYVCKYDLYVCMCVHVGVRESVCVWMRVSMALCTKSWLTK